VAIASRDDVHLAVRAKLDDQSRTFTCYYLSYMTHDANTLFGTVTQPEDLQFASRGARLWWTCCCGTCLLSFRQRHISASTRAGVGRRSFAHAQPTRSALALRRSMIPEEDPRLVSSSTCWNNLTCHCGLCCFEEKPESLRRLSAYGGVEDT